MRYIWQRYFLREFIKIFCLFITAFYFLYVLIDYSAHTKTFQSIGIQKAILYYLFQFTKRCDILIPFAILLATVKVLSTLTLRNETIALVVGGIPLKWLIHPLWKATFFCALFLYINFQWLQPFSLARLNTFEEVYFKQSVDEEKAKQVCHLLLKDRSLLIYQSYDPIKNAFFDAYWIKSLNEIYRIKFLFPYSSPPSGQYVDLLIKEEDGLLQKKESWLYKDFHAMHIEEKSLFSAVHPPRWQSIAQLGTNLSWKHFGVGVKMSDREAQTVSSFCYKLLMPLLCFLIVLAISPFCLCFERNFPIFFIYAFSIFGLIAFFTLINAFVILGEGQVIPPGLSVSIPFALSFLAFGLNYGKL
jgi:lipopolysaccharide export system permease protein